MHGGTSLQDFYFISSICQARDKNLEAIQQSWGLGFKDHLVGCGRCGPDHRASAMSRPCRRQILSCRQMAQTGETDLPFPKFTWVAKRLFWKGDESYYNH